MCSDGETGGVLVFLCFLFSGGGYLLTGLFLKSFFTYLSRNILIKNEYYIDMCALAMVSSHFRVLMFLELLRAVRNTWAVSKPNRFSNLYPLTGDGFLVHILHFCGISTPKKDVH